MNSRSNSTWRLLDSGVRRAAENFAFNRAILDAHRDGDSPHTLRFLGFRPSALIGFHQDPEQELNLDYIREQGIDIQRRLTGGGAIYFDEQQFGWELYLNRQVMGTADMGQIAERICNTVAAALRQLGVDARFRPRNDIEVDGRKISGTGGYFDGDSFLYQGTVLVDFDVERMMRVLRIPLAKITDKAISDARQRITTLREHLADRTPTMDSVKQQLAEAIAAEFGIDWQISSQLTPKENEYYRQALEEIDSQDWIEQHNRPLGDAPLSEAMWRCSGGLLKCAILLDNRQARLKQVWITGDFFIRPRRLVADLEAQLRNLPVAELEGRVKRFFETADAELLMLSPEDFIAVIQAAIAAAEGGLD